MGFNSGFKGLSKQSCPGSELQKSDCSTSERRAFTYRRSMLLLWIPFRLGFPWYLWSLQESELCRNNSKVPFGVYRSLVLVSRPCTRI